MVKRGYFGTIFSGAISPSVHSLEVHDSATEGVMPTPHARAVYFIVLRGNLLTKLYLPRFPTYQKLPRLALLHVHTINRELGLVRTLTIIYTHTHTHTLIVQYHKRFGTTPNIPKIRL